jgi:hypothetical protein
MSSWTCYSGSNNIHFNYPAILSDGRLFTSYQPEAVINERIQQDAHIKSNWDYRMFLQQNADKIIRFNETEICNYVGLPQHIETSTTPANNVPFRFHSSFDSARPGFGYCNSDLKSPYLTREQLNARLISPSISIPKK